MPSPATYRTGVHPNVNEADEAARVLTRRSDLPTAKVDCYDCRMASPATKHQEFQKQDQTNLQKRLSLMIVAWQVPLHMEQETIPKQKKQMKQLEFWQEDQIYLEQRLIVMIKESK